jgi:hypothetical protein
MKIASFNAPVFGKSQRGNKGAHEAEFPTGFCAAGGDFSSSFSPIHDRKWVGLPDLAGGPV